MHWVQSWPNEDILRLRRHRVVYEAGNSYDLEAIGIQNYDLSSADNWDVILNRDIPGFTLIEWDMAISREDKEQWEQIVPRYGEDFVQVAPYRLYPKSTGLDEIVWAHRTKLMVPEETWILEGEPFCDSFSFGMVWLPMPLVRAFKPAPSDPRFTDVNFSIWHQQNVLQRVPVHWQVRPTHLHY